MENEMFQEKQNQPIESAEPVKEREHIELKFDHTKTNIFEAIGLTLEDGVKFMETASDAFNEISMVSESKSELIEYLVTREKDEQAVLFVGILMTRDMEKKQSMFKSELGSILGMTPGSMEDDCDCPNCTERRAREADKTIEPETPEKE